MPRLRLGCSRSGQASAETLIVICLVAVAVIALVVVFARSISGHYEDTSSAVSQLEQGTRYTAESEAGTRDGADSSDELNRSEADQVNLAEAHHTKTDALRDGNVGIDPSEVTQDITLSGWELLAMAVVVVVIGIAVVTVVRRKPGGKSKSGSGNEASDDEDDPLSSGRSQKGQAMVEFSIIVITFLVCLLAVLQIALCINAYMTVRYAAYNAARSAIVHGVDRDRMHRAARMSLLPIYPWHGRAATVAGFVDGYLAAQYTDTRRDWKGLGRNDEPITSVTLHNVRGVAHGETVTFDDPIVGSKANITIQVKHYYQLVIPLANAIIYYAHEFFAPQEEKDLNEMAEVAYGDSTLYDSPFFSGYRIPLVAYYTMRLQSDLHLTNQTEALEYDHADSRDSAFYGTPVTGVRIPSCSIEWSGVIPSIRCN